MTTAAAIDEVDRQLRMEAMHAAARKKAGMGPEWQPYIYERVTGGILITGCRTRPKMRGPNKGEPHFLTKEDRVKVLVTRADIDRRYRAMNRSKQS